MKFFFFFFLLFTFSYAFSQPKSDTKLAYTYYNNKQYDKAAILFLQLYERTHSSNFLDYHIVCLINGKMYDQAEETIKKYLKTNDNNKDLWINLGFVYAQQGKIKKSEECYEKVVRKLIPNTSDINSIAGKFRNIRAYEWAEKTYMKGREILKKPNAFLVELGDCYMMERNYERMFDLFIEDLNLNPGHLNSITSKLNFARSYDMVNNVDGIIERKLTEIFRTASYPSVFDELGVWYTLQKKQYKKAFEHALLLNQKEENKLNCFLDIAREASTDQQEGIALQAYNKILEKGKEKNPYYSPAYRESLTCRYNTLNRQNASTDSFRELTKECKNYLKEFPTNTENTDIAILLADIYAYRLEQPDSANNVLTRALKTNKTNRNKQNLLKSKQADLLAFMNNPWEATILYTQIEKSNPNNDLGYEAKLKKARLAYYSGDLLWAKAQFDVLQGATTKLIANDALKIAHFIAINYKPEEDNTDLITLGKAEYLIYKRKHKEALTILDSLIENSASGIADYAALCKAKLLIATGQIEEANKTFEVLKNSSEQTYVRAEAIYQLADLKVKQHSIPEALELYKQMVSDYPGSVYSVEAGKLYREIIKKEQQK